MGDAGRVKRCHRPDCRSSAARPVVKSERTAFQRRSRCSSHVRRPVGTRCRSPPCQTYPAHGAFAGSSNSHDRRRPRNVPDGRPGDSTSLRCPVGQRNGTVCSIGSHDWRYDVAWRRADSNRACRSRTCNGDLLLRFSIYRVADFEKWGIVTKVFPDAELDDAAMNFARKLAKGPTQALKATKRLIRAAAEGGASTADRLVGLVGAPLLETHDMQAGGQAVAKHGARNFSGKFDFQG